MKRFYNMKLLYQVALSIAVTSILLSMIVGLVLIRNSSLHVTEEVKSKYSYLISDYTHQFDIRTTESEAVVNNLWTLLSLDNDLENVFDSQAEKYVFYEKYQKNIDVIGKYQEFAYDVFVHLQSDDRTQEMIMTSYDSPSSKIYDEIRALSVNAITNKDYNEGGFWLGFDDKNLFCYLRPVIVNGKFKGVVGGRFRTFGLVWGIGNISELIKSDLILYDQDFNSIVLSHYLPGKLNSDIRPFKTKIERNAFGMIEYKDPSKGDLMIGHSRLANGWTIVLQMSKRDVLERSYELFKLLTMLLIIGGVFSLFIAVSVSSRLTEPIADLAVEMRRIGAGDYDTQLSDEYMIYNNEIGILATTVETMRFSISRYIKEIEDNAKNLERLVNERTSELMMTNEYLEQSLAEIEEKKAEMILINDELEQTLENLRGTQEQLIESRKLSALSDLVNGVAHQLNTPIGVSITAISFLEKEINDFYKLLKSTNRVDEEVKESFIDISSANQLALKNLTKARDTLDTFKYITANSSNEKPINLDLCEFLTDLTAALMVKAEYVKYKLNFNCEREIMIKGYPSILTQIMTNLISNSVNHGFRNSDHGTIDIKLTESDHYITIDYRDDGVGIPDENAERIFDPFFTTQMGKERIGLGLSIVYNYVTVKMQGRIRCELGVKNGSHFIIQIPK